MIFFVARKIHNAYVLALCFPGYPRSCLKNRDRQAGDIPFMLIPDQRYCRYVAFMLFKFS